MNIEEGTYVSHIWFIACHDRDWMCTLSRTGPADTWTLEYRFRYYNAESTDPFDGKDEKSIYTATVEGKTEREVIAITQQMAEDLAAKMGGRLESLPVRSDDVHTIMAVLRAQPWCHMKEQPLERR